jgi:outer membrane protein assembly factor BamB
MRQDFVDKLELELRAAGERRARPWRIARRQLLAPAVAALGVLAIAVALAGTVLRSEDTIPAQASPRLIANTAVVSQGGSMASAFGAVWVADIARERLLRLDPHTRAVDARIPLGGAAWVTAAGGSVWALGSDRLLRIDPSNNRVVASIPSRSGAPGMVLEGAGVVWMAYPQALLRVDLRRNAVTRTVPTSRSGFKALGAVSDGRVLYLTRSDGRLLRVDARSGKVLSAVRAPFGGWLLGVAGGAVFVAGDSGVTAVDAATGRPRWTRDLRAERVNEGTFDGTTVWVQATDRATMRDRLWRIDARTGHVTGSLTLPEFGAAGIVTAGKQVWTMSVGGDLQVALKKG